MSRTNDKPIISATIFYYDDVYSVETAETVLSILERYDMFPPHKIHIGKLTRNRFALADSKTRDLFMQGYYEKDVFGIDMSSGDSRTASEYWRVDWGFTYYKNSRLTGPCIFKPWNTMTLQSTHGRLQNVKKSQDFISCIKELIELLNPFYVAIDDLQNKLRIMEKANETHFDPNNLQTVYWGNYLGEDYCTKMDISSLFSMPVYAIERIGNGVFFTLSNSVLDFRNVSIEHLRKQIKNQLFKNV